jgi:hypothetical protein
VRALSSASSATPAIMATTDAVERKPPLVIRATLMPYSAECVERPSEKPHERANLLAIRPLIATLMNASLVSGNLS